MMMTCLYMNGIFRLGPWSGRATFVVYLSLLACLGASAELTAALITPEEMNSVRVYKKMAQVTVLIASAYTSSHHITETMDRGLGSGVLIDEHGSIVTNAHVVEGAAKIVVILHDGSRLPAELIGADPQSDVALLRVALPKGQYPHAHLGDSDKLEVGQKVLAIGHPFGLAYAMSSGIISGFGKLLETRQQVFQDRIIQTTAPLNPGEQRGPTRRFRGPGDRDEHRDPDGSSKYPLCHSHQYGEIDRDGLRGPRPRDQTVARVKGKFVTEELRTLIALPS